jgi:Ca2+-binding EF-hand superfamily protein
VVKPHLMALLLTVLLCRFAVVAGSAVGSLSVRRQQHGELSTAPHSNQPDCLTIQPPSLLQKVLHPWKGDYQTTRTCLDVPVLHNTAKPHECSVLEVVVLLNIILGFPIGLCCVMAVGPCALPFFLLPLMYAWWYIVSTGLFADYWASAIVLSQYTLTPATVHNCSRECVGLVAQVYGLTIIVTFYCVLLSCILMPYFVASRMMVERHATTPFLDPADREHIESDLFRMKCIKAFNEADADHNGRLDLSELQHVVLFDLTDEQKEYVKSHSLFKEAFEECDEDKSNSIDQREFLEVMKFIMTKAKFASSKPSEQPTDSKPSEPPTESPTEP